MIVHFVLGLAAVAATAPAPPEAPADRARSAFARLSAAEQKDVVDFLESEIARVRTFQMDLARWLLASQDRDPKLWPAEEARAWFDPQRHAPAQPIPRRRLAADDPRLERVRRELGVTPNARAWAYDWASGDIVHRATHDTPARAFELAVAGLHPRHDLLRALVERALDDGAERRSLAAFEHAYTDRSGNAYPGITLYDAWRSGAEIEMPDVDCLGIVNTVLDDWTTWTSVVPGHRQESLYQNIGELFQPAHRHRELRVAVAATFLEATPGLCCGYEGSIGNFHALWEDCASTPATLRARLPSAAGWREFLAGWVERCTQDGALYQRGLARQATLASEGATIRAVLDGVLEEYGAFARLREATGTKDR